MDFFVSLSVGLSKKLQGSFLDNPIRTKIVHKET